MYSWDSRLFLFCFVFVFFHVLSLENQSNVVIRTAGTDCQIIGFRCDEKLDPFWKYGWSSGYRIKNSLRFISVDSVYSNLGKNFSKILPASHAFTGSDFIASFSGKEKMMIRVTILQKLNNLHAKCTVRKMWKNRC